MLVFSRVLILLAELDAAGNKSGFFNCAGKGYMTLCCVFPVVQLKDL